ncbi:MAG: ATP-dependent helicase [Burkholderiaceae bacterium]|nr:MAG: ATP-dependent helicase [Burkholderiaceae bacterium]TBR76653.1 MAG: ATP-dependent helicase [Burkholderiaceae bacterium]
MAKQAQRLFGAITLEGGFWRIECEAHVRSRLKRMFPQVNQRAGDVVMLSDSDENSRELLWFTERFPMKVTPLKWMRQRAAGHIESENRVIELLAHRRLLEDFELAKPPRDYQREAIMLAMLKGGLLLADDPGIGKTVTAICGMSRQQHLPALVVTLSHLTNQWRKKISEFAPGLNVHTLKSGRPYDLLPKAKCRRKQQPELFADDPTTSPKLPDVIISNYHKLHGWSDVLAGLVRFVAFDEVQELRHTDSNKYAAARHIASKADLRLGLSATPIYNMGEEFHSVIEVLLPGALGTREEFLREWCVDDQRIKDPKAFGAHLRREGIMLRRTRKDVGRELPPCQIVPHTINSDRRELEKIRSTAAELARVILASQQAFQGQKFRASQEFDALMRQATGIAKAPFVAEFVKMLMASEEKVIVYAWHREVYTILQEQLREFNPLMFTGSESAKQKEEAKQAFIHGDCRILLMSLRAGAGTDGLQSVCKVGVFAELDWSPSVHHQCITRFWRDEQDEPSMAYFLLSEDGSDPIVSEIVGVKKGQVEGVTDPDAALIESLETDPGNMKMLARAYLEKLGEPIPAESKNQSVAQESAAELV